MQSILDLARPGIYLTMCRVSIQSLRIYMYPAYKVASLFQLLTILSTFSAQCLLHDIQCIHMERGEHEEYDGDFLFLIACVESEL